MFLSLKKEYSFTCLPYSFQNHLQKRIFSLRARENFQKNNLKPKTISACKFHGVQSDTVAPTILEANTSIIKDYTSHYYVMPDIDAGNSKIIGHPVLSG